ncbi:hypothetical protein W02_42820 [Nitrospira sp. KM1]|nr:hypothetical protein W02_42820 [Nitrospira sp. KM1]
MRDESITGRKHMVVIFVLFGFLPAMAQPAFAEFEFSVYGGTSITPKIDLTVTLPQSNVSVPGVKVDNSITGGVKIGYWLDKMSSAVSVGFGLDGFYFEPKIDRQTVPSTTNFQGITFQNSSTVSPLTLETFGIGIDVFKLRLHLLEEKNFPMGRLQPQLSIGPSVFVVNVKDTTNFAPNNQQQHQTSVGLKAGAGVQFLFTQYLGVFAEYRFTRYSMDVAFRAQNNVASQNITADINTHHLVGGLSLHF